MLKVILKWVAHGAKLTIISRVDVMLALGMETVQITRRLYECAFLQKRSSARMHALHYIAGFGFYVFTPVALIVDGLGNVMDASSISPTAGTFSTRYVAAFLLFLWASYEQHVAHVQLSKLRSTPSKSPNEPPLYSLPQGRYFDLVACPHYFFEIMIYLSFVVLTGGKSLVVWSVVVWVAIELGTGADLSYKWYKSRFKETVKKDWSRMVPHQLNTKIERQTSINEGPENVLQSADSNDDIVPGYKDATIIFSNEHLVVYRARRATDEKPFMLKYVVCNDPQDVVVVMLKAEYRLLKELEESCCPFGLIKAEDMIFLGKGAVLVVEDIGGTSLTQWVESRQGFLVDRKGWGPRLSTGFFLNEVLTIVKNCAVTLEKLHGQKYIHKDITPNNIITVFRRKHFETRLIDLSVACHLSTQAELSSAMEGTLAYIPPEQTGATFYFLLTGLRPFQDFETDELSIIHAHLARPVIPPHVVDSRIPKIISEMVLKLMQKAPEERYQTASGISADIDRYVDECFQTSPEYLLVDGHEFTLGEFDIANRFSVPEKLYGRSKEVELLSKVFRQTCQLNIPSVFWVAGYSGIGKTRFVNEILKDVTGAKGIYITGKCNQIRNRPLSCFIQSFQSLIKKILASSPEEVARYKTLFTSDIRQPRLIIEVLPEIVGVLESPPDVNDGLSEASAMLNEALIDFISVVTKQSPLCIFVDDLQWGDHPTFLLFQAFAKSSKAGRLFLIGAYRSNELSEKPLLKASIDQIYYDVPERVTSVELGNFDLKTTVQFVADSFKGELSLDDGDMLGHIVFEKTRGNPYHMCKLLDRLYDDRFISGSTERSGDGALHFKWSINFQAIQETDSLSDNIIELLFRDLKQLNAETLKLLQYAAGIGSTFTYSILSKALDPMTPNDIIPCINHAILACIIKPITSWSARLTVEMDEAFLQTLQETDGLQFQWAHDRMEQAVYESIPPSEVPMLEWAVAKAWMSLSKENAESEVLYEAAEHFYKAFEREEFRSTLQQSDIDFAALTLIQAGSKAYQSTAMQAVIKYNRMAFLMLGERIWRPSANLTKVAFESHYQALKAAIYVGNADFRAQTFDAIMTHVDLPLQRAKALLAEAEGLETHHNPLCLDRCLEALAVLGLKFPRKGSTMSIIRTCAKFLWIYYRYDITLLPNKPEDMDERSQLVCSCLSTLAHYGYRWDFAYCLSIGIEILKIQTAKVADIIIGLADRYKQSMEKTDASALVIWSRDYRVYMEDMYDACLEGISIFAHLSTSAGMGYCWACNLLYMGKPLYKIKKEFSKLQALRKAMTQKDFALRISAVMQIVECLTGNAEDNFTMEGEWFGEDEKAVFLHHSLSSPNIRFVVWGLQYGLLSFWERDWFKCHEFMSKAREDKLKHVTFQIHDKMWPFYDAISSFGLLHIIKNNGSRMYHTTPLCLGKLKPPKVYLTIVHRGLKQLKKMAKWTPSTEEHRYHLLKAEYYRLQMRKEDFCKAIDHYEKAIRAARLNDFVNEAGLANELCAQFIESHDFPREAYIGYLQEAVRCYDAWGSPPIVQQMLDLYPFLSVKASPTKKLEHLRSESVHASGVKLRVSATINTTNSKTDRSGMLHSTGTVGQRPRNHSGTMTSKDDHKSLDLMSILKASQKISAQHNLHGTLKATLDAVLENSGASRAGLFQCGQDGSFFLIADTNTNQTIILDDCAESEFGGDSYITANRVRSVLCSPLSGSSGVDMKLLVYLEHHTKGVFTADRIEISKLLLQQAAFDIEKTQAAEAVSRFVPSELLTLLGVHSVQEAELGDAVDKVMTILFADIRGFTTISESMTPSECFFLVNRLLSQLVPELQSNDLVVDKFIGDAIMALSAEDDVQRGAENAVKAGIAMQRALYEFNKMIKNEDASFNEQLRLGIGIHTGDTMLGLLGSAERMNVTVISDSVNTASRVESITKVYNATMIITDRTFQFLPNPSNFAYRPLDDVIVKGQSKPVRLYEIIDAEPDIHIREKKLAVREVYERAFEAYLEGKVNEAHSLFSEALMIYSEDIPSQRMVQRCNELLAGGVLPEGWRPVYVMSEK
ncbi:hypothetical protein HDU76_012341 [Blyttiomyces sp. JEL0837]|nr:hypothetical protein HDU76_012341 [Blyttiomyces sp. JEL0837]